MIYLNGEQTLNFNYKITWTRKKEKAGQNSGITEKGV